MAKVMLSNASVDDLKKEIQRRQAALPALIAQRDELSERIAELQALGQTAPGSGAGKAKPGRPVGAKDRRLRNELSLPRLLSQLLEAKPGQSVDELMRAALIAGYKSKSKSFKAIVRQTLYHDQRFKRVGKGKFALKG
jgi:hypothetical protein